MDIVQGGFGLGVVGDFRVADGGLQSEGGVDVTTGFPHAHDLEEGAREWEINDAVVLETLCEESTKEAEDFTWNRFSQCFILSLALYCLLLSKKLI